MAKSLVTTDGNLTIPGAYAKYTVQQSPSGLATTGVLMLVGEAEAGPDWTLEDDLEANAFGPDQMADIQAKYKSGPLVDAANAASSPANDPNITGSFNRIILAKTNVSGKASATLLKYGGGTYGTLADTSYGKTGNQTYFTVAANTTEVVPSTGAFTLLVPIAAFDYSIRVNGGTSVGGTVAGTTLPPAVVSAINALAGVAATGGANRGILASAAGNLALTIVSGNAVRIDYTGTWAVTPSVGDTVYLPSGTVLAGAGNANLGSYVVTSATTNSIFCTKLLDATGTPNQLTAPVAVTTTAVVAVTDVEDFASVIIFSEASNPVDGEGKTLEINDLTTNTGLFSYIAYALNTSVVSWLSKPSAPTALNSSVEYTATLNVNRQSDNVSDQITTGGEIGLQISYTTTGTATMTITSTTLTTTVTGGSGTSLSITLADWSTLSDLATYINSQAGYKAAVGTAIIGQLPSNSTDYGTFGIATTEGAYTGRVKIDAYRFFQRVSGGTAVVQLNNPATRATAGLPAPTSNVTYLAGGSKGFTTNALVTAAIDALESVRGNFVIPLFSRDASADIADGLTDPSSTYTVDSINLYSRSHVLKMSTLKRRRNRQAVLSKKDTFTNAKTAASNIASYRCNMTFQDIKNVNSQGNIAQFQPWMGAAVAAATQAAGFYRSIEHKFLDVSGALQAAKDFKDQNDTQMEDALIAGLMPIKQADTGGYFWVSDQTTYGKDNNFVFNSMQAVYVADTISLTTAQRMENSFVGQSVADISASIALSCLEGIMGDFKRLKLIAPSDDGAPNGFKNAKIAFSQGNSMLVSVEVKLAGSIDFIKIDFLVTPVQQTAGQ